MTELTEPLLVAGVGNIFLGDDGFGPEVVRRLAERCPDLDGVRVVDYGIRGMHLAYDLLDGYAALVIVDAIPANLADGGSQPGSIKVLEVDPASLRDDDFDAHGMNPVAVLGNLDRLGGELPPTYIVGCCTDDVEEGIGLSRPVAAAIDGAVDVTRKLLDKLLADQRQKAR